MVSADHQKEQQQQQQQHNHDDTSNNGNFNSQTNAKQLHIAPMLHVSNEEFRHFFRLLSKKCVLWTEMVVDETLVYSQHDKNLLDSHLGSDHSVEQHHPVICQIGGMHAPWSAEATRMVESYGYGEINLNMDCPSDRVSGKRHFGAVLMKELDQAVSILQAMHKSAQTVPVSVKCRVGVDELDSFDYLVHVIQRLSPYCQRFYLHARKCVLGGLTPEQNRLVPPLNYPRVYALCERFPNCQFWINGGIPGLRAAKEILYGRQVVVNAPFESADPRTEATTPQQKHQVPCTLCRAPNGSCTAPPPSPIPSNLVGCMLGRAAMDNPSQFWDVDRFFYDMPENPCRNRRQVLDLYCDYLEQTYPRRCCDDDERTTNRVPAPDVVPQSPYCPICREFRSNPNESSTTTPTKDNNSKCNNNNNNNNNVKIRSKVIDRSLKPVLNIFFRQPGSKSFRRQCEILSRDTTIRNCGPAFILHKALEVMKPDVLDQDFVLTEDLKASDITVHVSPPPNCCC